MSSTTSPSGWNSILGAILQRWRPRRIGHGLIEEHAGHASIEDCRADFRVTVEAGLNQAACPYDPIPVHSYLCHSLPPPSGTLPRSGAISSRLFSAPTVAASAAGLGDGGPGLNLGGRDRLPVPVPAVKTENGRGGLASGGHTYKSETPGYTTMTMPPHVRRVNATERFAKLTKVVPRNIGRQITYADIHSVPLPLYRTPVFRGRAQPREMIREMGS